MTNVNTIMLQGSKPLEHGSRVLGSRGGRGSPGLSRGLILASALLAWQGAACDRATPVAPPIEQRTQDETVVQRVVQRASANEPLTVMIEPAPATADSDLTAVANDAGVVFTWSINGFPVEGASNRVLPKTLFRRSDTVAVAVTLKDQSARAEVTVDNASPRAVEVSLDRPLEALRAGVDLTAIPKGVDSDGDDITWEYQWIRNDEEIPGETTAVLRADRYRRGDRITVRVTPSDAFTRGESYIPSAVTVPNAAPAFVSRPPGLRASPEYVYQVQAADPDGDEIQYRLVKAPGSMTVDPSTGVIRWPLQGTTPGRHSVEIEISDGQGATASQPFELELAPPEGS